MTEPMFDQQIEADPNVRICADPDCENPLASDAHKFARYCPEHAKGARPKSAKPRGRPRKDTPPKIVFDINSKSTGESAMVQRVQKGAEAYLKVASLGLQMMGDEVCAAAVAAGSKELAAALAQLSKYQPALQKIFAPISASDQTAAWLGVAVASAPVLLPVLAHHNLLPKKAGVLLSGFMVGSQMEADDASGSEA